MRFLCLSLLLFSLCACDHYEPTIRQDDDNTRKHPGLFTGKTGSWKIPLVTKKEEIEPKN